MRALWVFTLIVFAGCAAPPRATVPPPARDPAPTTRPAPSLPAPAEPAPRSSIVRSAESYLGTPYRYGGSSREGLDCSGLVLNVFRENGIGLPRTSASQYRVGEKVGREQLRPGDLVFFASSGGRSPLTFATSAPCRL